MEVNRINPKGALPPAGSGRRCEFINEVLRTEKGVDKETAESSAKHPGVSLGYLAFPAA